MICHAILRRTRDWERVRPDSLDAPFLCRAAVQWERSFPLGYGACRARIKALSLEHLRALPARVTEAPTRRPADVDRAAVRDGDVVLLCDDDDLFHPRLIEHLETVRTAGSWDRVVIWPDGKHGFHKAPDGEGPVLLPRVLERPLDDENLRGPYVAIPGRLLRRTPEVLDAFWTHAATVETFANRRSPVAKVSTALSLTAKHPCSVSILRRAPGDGRGCRRRRPRRGAAGAHQAVRRRPDRAPPRLHLGGRLRGRTPGRLPGLPGPGVRPGRSVARPQPVGGRRYGRPGRGMSRMRRRYAPAAPIPGGGMPRARHRRRARRRSAKYDSPSSHATARCRRPPRSPA